MKKFLSIIVTVLLLSTMICPNFIVNAEEMNPNSQMTIDQYIKYIETLGYDVEVIDKSKLKTSDLEALVKELEAVPEKINLDNKHMIGNREKISLSNERKSAFKGITPYYVPGKVETVTKSPIYYGYSDESGRNFTFQIRVWATYERYVEQGLSNEITSVIDTYSEDPKTINTWSYEEKSISTKIATNRRSMTISGRGLFVMGIQGALSVKKYVNYTVTISA